MYKIEVFISFAQDDEALRKELEAHLTGLEQQGLIKIWHNRKVTPGADLKQEIIRHLNAAQIILLLISPAFLVSEGTNAEMMKAIERHNAGEALVIPVILRPTHFKGAPFDHLKILPSNGEPVASSGWHDHDEAFFNVVDGVQEAVKELRGPTLPHSDDKTLLKESFMIQASDAQGKQDFDVFLCHNSINRPAVIKIAEQLIERGIKPWLDIWELRPGLPWQRILEAQIEQIKAAAVFVGKDGIGPWQHMEFDAFLSEFVSRGCPVIPVLLEDAPDKPQLPPFLRGMTWVDFRRQDPDLMEQLIWGITGKRFGSGDYAAGGGNNESRKVVIPPTKPTSLPSWKRRDLEERHDMLLEERKMLAERIRRVREAWRLETNEAIKMQQEHQFKKDEAALVPIDAELEKIEQALQ